MSTPPGLLGAAVLFWGWQTGLLVAATVIALALEASQLVAWRWDLSRADVRRIADVCRLILVIVTIYVWATRGGARTVLGLIAWFPLALLPLVLCQAYGPAAATDLRTFFLIIRRRRTGEDPAVNLSYPYLLVCIAAASAGNGRTCHFYAGLCVLAAWALWPARSRAFAWPAWVVGLVVAAAAGWAGQAGLHQLQGMVEAAIAELAFDYTGTKTDPFRSRTALGTIGRLKLSDRILYRVEPGRPAERPLLLHEASYNLYTATVWGAVEAEFERVPPRADRRTWELAPAPPTGAGETVTISAYLKRGRGMVLVPTGTFRLEGLLALQMMRNRLGAMKVEEGLGLVTYRARFAPDRSLGGPPTELDLKLPAREAPLLTRIAGELGLGGRSGREAAATVARYFGGFHYSTYLDAPARGTSPLEDFFVRTRAGHCEYFATATVLLLRAAGIPARYATGYSVQEWSTREQRYLVRARHGHSWALVYLDGSWRDLDTTPAAWATVEGEAASVWEPLADLASWAMFLFSRWRWADQETGYLRHAGWLLLPLVGFLAWRLYGKRRVARGGVARQAEARSAVCPGADSEFYLVEAELARRGLGRQPWEPVSSWLTRVEGSELAGLAALHSRYRFDPNGLDVAEREALRAGVRDWLARQPVGVPVFCGDRAEVTRMQLDGRRERHGR